MCEASGRGRSSSKSVTLACDENAEVADVQLSVRIHVNNRTTTLGAAEFICIGVSMFKRAHMCVVTHARGKT